eukprot:23988_1
MKLHGHHVMIHSIQLQLLQTKHNELFIINQFRLCFHSDSKIRYYSHKKIIDFYIESIINKTENEEKLNKLSDIDSIDINIDIDIEKEKSKIDELIRISNYDFSF